MRKTIALCVALCGTALLVAGAGDDAPAKGAKRQTAQMIRPAGGGDADAQGTITVTHGKRADSKVIRLSHLTPRTLYEIRDSDTGALLGKVRTNRKGNAVFNLSKSLARRKKASANGADASDPQSVDVVDPSTGDQVLTGDVTPPAPVPAEGYAYVSDDAGDSADVFVATNPDKGDVLSVNFYPVNDPNVDPTTGDSFFYDLNLDTTNGDTLPLGAQSVSEFAGRAFEIHAADGTVVLAGTMPNLDPIDVTPPEDPGFPGDPVPMPGGCPGMGGPNFDPSVFDGSFADPSQFPNGGSLPPGNAYFGPRKSATKRAHKKGAGADPFTLFLADAEGALHDVADLTQESNSDPFTGDPTGGFDPNSEGGFTIIVIFMPMGSFDLDALFQQIMSGGVPDPSGGQSGDSSNGAAPQYKFF